MVNMLRSTRKVSLFYMQHCYVSFMYVPPSTLISNELPRTSVAIEMPDKSYTQH